MLWHPPWQTRTIYNCPLQTFLESESGTHFSLWRRAARWRGRCCWGCRCSCPRPSCWRYWRSACSPWSGWRWSRWSPWRPSPRGSWPSCRCDTRRCTGAGWGWSPARRSGRWGSPRPRGTPRPPWCTPRGTPRWAPPAWRWSRCWWTPGTRRCRRPCPARTWSGRSRSQMTDNTARILSTWRTQLKDPSL